MPEIPPQQEDPIVSRPMTLLALVSICLLLATVTWSFYSGNFLACGHGCPIRTVSARSISDYLDKQIKTRKSAEQGIYTTAEYQKREGHRHVRSASRIADGPSDSGAG